MDCTASIARAPRRWIVGILILLASHAALADRPPSPVDPATIDVGHPTGHVHDHGSLTWPPQPQGMKNPVVRSDAAEQGLEERTRKLSADAQENVALARADVRRALGKRYTRTSVSDRRDKSGASTVSRLEYFSHSKNRTVEVEIAGQQVSGLRTIPPTEYQPEISDAEIAEAEALARAHFAEGDEARLAGLQAFGILAYRPEGNGFYPTRVLYISFHRDSDAPPEYVAWVDLTERRVLRAREEKP